MSIRPRAILLIFPDVGLVLGVQNLGGRTLCFPRPNTLRHDNFQVLITEGQIRFGFSFDVGFPRVRNRV